MIAAFLRGARFRDARLFCILALLSCFSTAALAANNITGSVRNQTRAEPAAGDQVILLRVEKEASEEARATTDPGGLFTVSVKYPEKPYIMRVIHEGVSYEQQASAGQTLSISVFDSAPRVAGVSGGIEILRAGTVGNQLHVSDMMEIINQSNPPRTQSGERAFEVYLPVGANIDSVMAAGPETLAEMISAAPVPGDPGHYTLNFPLRPGATKFAVNYDLPYQGEVTFRMKHAYPLQQMAVMIPPTMKFTSASRAFQLLPTGNARYHVEAANHLQAGDGPEFEISGAGALPPLQEQAKAQQPSVSPRALNSTDPRPSEVPAVAASPGQEASPPARLSPPPAQSLARAAASRATPLLAQPPSDSQFFLLLALTGALLVSALLFARHTRRAHRIRC